MPYGINLCFYTELYIRGHTWNELSQYLPFDHIPQLVSIDPTTRLSQCYPHTGATVAAGDGPRPDGALCVAAGDSLKPDGTICCIM